MLSSWTWQRILKDVTSRRLQIKNNQVFFGWFEHTSNKRKVEQLEALRWYHLIMYHFWTNQSDWNAFMAGSSLFYCPMKGNTLSRKESLSVDDQSYKHLPQAVWRHHISFHFDADGCDQGAVNFRSSIWNCLLFKGEGVIFCTCTKNEWNFNIALDKSRSKNRYFGSRHSSSTFAADHFCHRSPNLCMTA